MFMLLLPNPHEAGWETCLSFYRFMRRNALVNIRKLHEQLDSIEQWVSDAERAGHLDEGQIFRIDCALHHNAVLTQMERNHLWSARLYLDNCRAVHGMSDRAMHSQIIRNLTNGIPPHATRRMLQDGMRRDH